MVEKSKKGKFVGQFQCQQGNTDWKKSRGEENGSFYKG